MVSVIPDGIRRVVCALIDRIYSQLPSKTVLYCYNALETYVAQFGMRIAGWLESLVVCPDVG